MIFVVFFLSWNCHSFLGKIVEQFALLSPGFEIQHYPSSLGDTECQETQYTLLFNLYLIYQFYSLYKARERKKRRGYFKHIDADIFDVYKPEEMPKCFIQLAWSNHIRDSVTKKWISFKLICHEQQEAISLIHIPGINYSILLGCFKLGNFFFIIS